MNCLKCNAPLENTYKCPRCGYEDRVAKKIIYSSNWHYNQGLAKARIRDLSGAMTSLNQALKYNKRNTDARNLLGLIHYQMGEVVAALNEWVISLHFQPNDNGAEAYIQDIQNNQAELKQANKLIQRYNQALSYVQEDNADMAIIELKRVVNLNPSYVRAYQLLGLLYIQRKQYASARKVLMCAVKVDRNNITTLNYLKELNHLQGKSGKKHSSGGSKMQINDPNPIVIEDNTGQGYTDYSTGFLSFINVLIGIVIGAGVIWLLVVPSITKSKTTAYNQAVVAYSAQISERNKTIDELENEIEELEATLASYESSGTETISVSTTTDLKLIEAAYEYMQENLTSAGYLIAEIDSSTLSTTSEKRMYKILKAATKSSVTKLLYQSALESFENGSYLDAIEGFTKVLRMDSTYTSAIYYMGRTYDALGDAVNAAGYYRKLIQSYPNSQWVADAQTYLNALGDVVSGVEAVELDEATQETSGD